MNVSLDIGAYGLRSLHITHGGVQGRKCRSVYSVLPDNSTQRKLLEQAQIPFGHCEDHLLLMGNAALEYSRLFQSPYVSLLPDGVLPHDDPPARQILALMVDALLPAPAGGSNTCCLTLPSEANSREQDFFTRLVRLKGYEPIVISAAKALTLAEMVADHFNGIALSFGAGHCEVSAAHCSRELARLIVPQGGDWIDRELAKQEKIVAYDSQGQAFLDVVSVRQRKETLATDERPLAADAFEKNLYTLTGRLVRSVFDQLEQRWHHEPALAELPAEVDVVYGGGMARLPGFDILLQRICQQTDLPFAVRSIQPADLSDYTVARGCLIHGQLEAGTAPENRAA